MLLLLLACAPKPSDTSPDRDSGFAHVDTSRVEDSTPTETAGDSGDSGATQPDPAWVALEASPARLTVNPGASFRVRLVGVAADGSRADVGGSWASTNDDIVAVDATGEVLALEAGSGTVVATVDGLSATVEVEVDDGMAAAVVVRDARTGLPLPGARVALPGSSGVLTGPDGVAALPVPDALPLDLSVWKDETYDAVTFLQVVGRRFEVALHPIDTTPADAILHGAVDYGAVPDAAWDELVLGLAAPAVPQLATMELDDWFSDDREISVFGVDTSLPANLVLEGVADDFLLDARPGDAGGWLLAGPIPVTEVSGATGSTADALALLVDHLPDLTWGWGGPVVATSGATSELGVAPAHALSAETVVSLPALPGGFTGLEEVLVLRAVRRGGEGWYVTGFGLGSGEAVPVRHVDDGVVEGAGSVGVVAYAQAGGIGGTGGTSVRVGVVDGPGVAHVDPLLDLPVVTTWDPADRLLAVDVDPGVDLVHVLLTDPRHLRHHLYAAGDWSGTLPNTLNDFGRGAATLRVDSVATVSGTFEERVGTADLDVPTLAARAAAHTRQE